MPPSTPDDENFTAFDEDVSFGLGSTSPLRRDLGSYSATDDVDGVLIYTHACSLRVGFNLDTPAVLKALERCGWSSDARTWKLSKPGGGASRYVLRGSKWLDERAPSNRKLPFVGRNEAWKTRIYSLAVETKGDHVHVDLQVVRHGDIVRFFEGVLALKNTDYKINYYRTIERYVVLPPHEAFKFAEQLGEAPVAGKGRKSRLRYLVKDVEVPVTIHKRAKATAQLVVYRVDRGATAAFKVELRLRGQRRDRKEFHQADVEKLDAVLLDLIDKYQLKTIPKPVRWEPRSFGTSLERGAFDPNVQKLPQKAWRGYQIPKRIKRIVELCHTPNLVQWVSCARDPDAFPPSTRIRTEVDSSSSSCSSRSSRRRRGRKVEWECVEGQGFEVTQYVLKVNSQRTQGSPTTSTTAPRDPWDWIVHDIHQSRVYFHEVILDVEQSPRKLLDALVGGKLGKVGVTGLCAVDAGGFLDMYQSAVEKLKTHPFEDDIETLVVVVDVSASLAVARAAVGDFEPQFDADGVIVNLDDMFQPGPLMPPEHVVPGMDALPALFKATGAWLDDLFAQLRQLGEQTGLKVIVVTCDGRPDHGRGSLLRTHFFKDGRVRSSVGDAGRYNSHVRYLVERVVVATRSSKGRTETTLDSGQTITQVYDARVEHEVIVGNIIVVKDEAEGQSGRLLYQGPVSRPRHYWKRKAGP